MSSVHRKKIFDQTPPPNYVAGLGRGATGFLTRSDIGPAKLAPEGPAVGSAPVVVSAGKDADDDKGDYSDATFDAWSGFSQNLFEGVEFDADDDEADRLYGMVDDRMDSRRKRQREERQQEQISKYRESRPKIQQLFSDLKRGLAGLSRDDWDSIPQIGDYRIKKRKQDIWTPVPDSVISSGISSRPSSALDSKQQSWGGMATPEGATPVTDLRALGEARGSLLSVKLKQISDSVTGQTVVDPKGYLTNLNHRKVTTDQEIGDIKRARLLLKSVTTTNPHHGPGWIAAARVEEIAGRIAAARKIAAEGTDACPTSEEVWLECIRLQTPQNAKSVMTKALEKVPHSVKLWIQASQLETEESKKKEVLRKALEIIPNSVRLWKELVELESAEDARILLSRAVECVNNVELWLALARLETYENAKAVLNKAREANPTEPMIWIVAAELEEANEHPNVMETIVKKAVKSIAGQTTREQWLGYAEVAEKAEHIGTCQAIIKYAVGLDLDEADRKHTWIADAERAAQNGCIATARAIYAHALAVFPGKKGLWLRAAQLEKEHGSHENLDQLLKRAVNFCPKAETLWLMAAKERWLQNDVPAAREILGEAFSANPDSEQIWLAAVKLESENNEIERARMLLQKARQSSDTPRIWMKSAKLERQVGNREEERRLLVVALKKWPKTESTLRSSTVASNATMTATTTTTTTTTGSDVVAKLWLMLLQWEVWKVKQWFPTLCLEGGKPCRGGGGPPPLMTFADPCALEDCNGPGGDAKRRAVTPPPAASSPSTSLVGLDSISSPGLTPTGMAKPASVAVALENLRTWYIRAYGSCPDTVAVWVAASEIEEFVLRDIPKARSILQKAMLRLPKNAELWVHAIRLEHRGGNEALTQLQFARALQECPNSGAVWSEVVELEPPATRRAKSQQAVKHCDKDARVIVAVAKLFWTERKIEKTRSWFNRAVALDRDFGDAWAYFYRFELQHGTEAQQADVLRKAVESDPKHGEKWTKVTKAMENCTVGGCRLSTEQVLKKVAALCEIKA